MPETHALLSASGAARWLACPPSAVLEAELPDVTSEAAEEGTLAHAHAEAQLNATLDNTDLPGDVPADMVDHVDGYVAYVLEQYAKAKETTADAVVAVEQRLDFSHVVPGGFGTGDCVIIAEPALHIIDFKYGKGVEVAAEENPQMRLYALGALAAFDSLYDIETVAMTIYQPRLANISTATMTVDELTEWAETVVAPTARLAADGEGDFQAGPWCQFCKLRATCRERARVNLELARHEFTPAATLTDDEIAEVLAKAPDLARWVSDVSAHALREAFEHGVHYPGFKLVEGRSNRAYADEDAAARKLRANKWKVADIYQPRKLLGITAMEKLLTKKGFHETLGDLVVKPAGKPTLVPDTDKRPALTRDSAVDDFTPEETK